ncbi:MULTISPECIES: hypothetical protein [Empedobacter]|uniref:hypothetical protein n=1 Tax=Empedobacter TaxID=59734 RepID=UPI0025775DF5|nr:MULTISPECIES: hypothetical protein [Empedobacter]MDM1042155.1 hypothetical protein [Empedobacter brevis]MDM1135971.1 hypothetical protein [Empedobacter sp. R750]
MTKKEKIKDAWGDYYLDVKEQIDEYGLVSEKFLTNNQCKTLNDDLSIEIYSPNEGYYFYRPNSLQGIETNNGWIKIESEDDLPKYIVDCWIIYKDKICLSLYQSKHFVLKSEFSLLPFNLISHYQPIERPKPPIY